MCLRFIIFTIWSNWSLMYVIGSPFFITWRFGMCTSFLISNTIHDNLVFRKKPIFQFTKVLIIHILILMAWEHTYPNGSDGVSKKKNFDSFVRYFFEGLKLWNCQYFSQSGTVKKVFILIWFWALFFPMVSTCICTSLLLVSVLINSCNEKWHYHSFKNMNFLYMNFHFYTVQRIYYTFSLSYLCILESFLEEILLLQRKWIDAYLVILNNKWSSNVHISAYLYC